MEMPIAVKIECAKGEILNALEKIRREYGFPACVMDGVISSVLADIRSEEKIELINATNALLKEKNEELEKVKKEAKKVLKSEPEQQEEGEQEQPEK